MNDVTTRILAGDFERLQEPGRPSGHDIRDQSIPSRQDICNHPLVYCRIKHLTIEQGNHPISSVLLRPHKEAVGITIALAWQYRPPLLFLPQHVNNAVYAE